MAEYTLKINLEGGDDAAKSIDSAKSGMAGLKDETSKYNAWLKKAANETERLAQSLTRGKWSISSLPISTIQGLKEPDYGKMLGKIHAMGSIEGQLKSKFKRHGEIDRVLGQQFLTPGGLPSWMGSDFFKKQKAVQMDAHVDAWKFQEKLTTKKRADEKHILRDQEAFYKNMSMIAGPIFSPGGGLSTMFAARQVFSALRTEKGKGILGKMGIGDDIASAGAATAVLIAGATSVGLALKGLKNVLDGAMKEITDMMKQYSVSSERYAKALQTGFGLGLTEKVSSISAIAGISEKDFFKFSKAIGDLSEKTKRATDAIANSTRSLVSVDREKKSAQLAKEAFDAERARTYSGLAFLHFQGTRERYEENLVYRKKINDFLEKLGLLAPRAPAPMASMNQLPASTWENMGLVVGMGGGVNAELKKANTYLKKMTDLMVSMQGSSSGGFGMSPLVANP